MCLAPWLANIVDQLIPKVATVHELYRGVGSGRPWIQAFDDAPTSIISQFKAVGILNSRMGVLPSRTFGTGRYANTEARVLAFRPYPGISLPHNQVTFFYQ